MDVLRSKLEGMRRSLDSAIAAMNAQDTGDKKKNPDDPRERLRGLDKEVGSVLSEVNDLHSKEDKSEKYDSSRLDPLEESVAELNTRVEAVLQAPAGARKAGFKRSSNEMSHMGLPDRGIEHACKAEQRLKVILQQCTQARLRPDAELRLREVQDNLAMHNLYIARFYRQRYDGHKGGLKGEQSRLQEIVD